MRIITVGDTLPVRFTETLDQDLYVNALDEGVVIQTDANAGDELGLSILARGPQLFWVATRSLTLGVSGPLRIPAGTTITYICGGGQYAHLWTF